MMQRFRVVTEDGSHSVFVPSLNEHYHSTHGAIRESRHVFIEQGLQAALEMSSETLKILEVGLGTGLNMFMSFLAGRKWQARIHYTAIENDPLPERFVSKLNYPGLLDAEDHRPLFLQMHRAHWNKPVQLTDDFEFIKYKEDFLNFSTRERFHVVYFDAFAPEVQPEMWELHVFKKLFGLMEEGGIMVTYCAKGVVKRSLKEVGFEVESLPGPKGKWEMTRARRISNTEQGLAI